MQPEMRDRIAYAVAYGCRATIKGVIEANQIRNTSDCPVVIVTIDGEVFNVTITKARKRK